jgi:nucleoside-diphosphate-sugar epimerase
VLVTGATGFIGTNLRERLLADGAAVHAVSRGAGTDDECSWHRVDLTDGEAVRKVVADVEPRVIYHLASHVSGSSALSEVRRTLGASIVGTVGILEAATECGCPRVVVVGSDKELGIGGGVPGSPYAAAKLAATGYVQMFHAVYGLSVVNLRVFMVYGPGQNDETKLVPHTISSLLAGVAPELSSGARRFDWVFVSDVVEALVRAGAATTGDDGAPIDIGSGRLTTIRDLVDAIASRIDAGVAPQFGAFPDRAPEPEFAARLGAAAEHLGWVPETSLDAGLDATIAWYRGRAAGRR